MGIKTLDTINSSVKKELKQFPTRKESTTYYRSLQAIDNRNKITVEELRLIADQVNNPFELTNTTYCNPSGNYYSIANAIAGVAAESNIEFSDFNLNFAQPYYLSGWSGEVGGLLSGVSPTPRFQSHLDELITCGYTQYSNQYNQTRSPTIRYAFDCITQYKHSLNAYLQATELKIKRIDTEATIIDRHHRLLEAMLVVIDSNRLPYRMLRPIVDELFSLNGDKKSDCIAISDDDDSRVSYSRRTSTIFDHTRRRSCTLNRYLVRNTDAIDILTTEIEKRKPQNLTTLKNADRKTLFRLTR